MGENLYAGGLNRPSRINTINSITMEQQLDKYREAAQAQAAEFQDRLTCMG